MWISFGMLAASQTSSSSWLDDVEHAAALEARRFLFIVEAHRHVDVHLGVLADAQEIDVDRPARYRVEVDRLGQGAVRLAARHRSSRPSS